jgi:sialate O-acetylesterase
MAYVRQAQALLAHGTGHISIVTSIDLPATRSFVASPQVELGKRIARHTRGVVYDAVSEAFGPTPIAFTREGTSLRIRFSNAGEGLVSHDRPIQSLEIASADKIFHPATARINGDSIIVSEASTTVPVYVRYAWSNAPTANLFNGSGSAAAPFLGAVGNP